MNGSINKQGFTLLEVLVSITIMGGVLVVLLGGLGANLKNLGLAGDYTTAAFLAKDAMTQLQTRDPAPGKLEGDFGPQFPRYKWTADLEMGEDHPFLKTRLRVVFERGEIQRELEVRTTILSGN